MSTIMSPSAVQENIGMTDGQIDKATDVFRASLRKHRKEFTTDATQQAITAKGLGSDLLTVFRTYVERFSNLIVRIVNVNRVRTPVEALDATGRKQYTDRKVVDSMPKGDGEEVEVVFFKPDLSKRNGFISNDDLEKEYELLGLKPADPYSVAAVNEADPAFADKKPHSTHWKNSDGKWCYASFFRWNDGRGVSVIRSNDGWVGNRWFAGVRK